MGINLVEIFEHLHISLNREIRYNKTLTGTSPSEKILGQPHLLIYTSPALRPRITKHYASPLQDIDKTYRISVFIHSLERRIQTKTFRT